MSRIINALVDASEFFYDLYLVVYAWSYPWYLMAYPIYSLCVVFNNLAWDFYNFGQVIDAIWDAVQDILSWSNIRSLITGWLRWIANPLGWFVYLWADVWDEINSWWPTVWPTILDAIDAAIVGLEGAWGEWLNFWNNLWPELLTTVNNFKAAWDNFWRYGYPELVSFTWLTSWWTSTMGQVQGLIDTAFTLRESLWDGWQDWRDKVTEFFTDPEDWLYKAADRIIERFW